MVEELLRQPTLPNVDLANLFKEERAEIIRDSPTSDGLSLLLTFLNNEIVKNVLFVYLYQVNDWFSSNECCKGGAVDTSQGYLIYNREFKAILNQLKDLDIYAEVSSALVKLIDESSDDLPIVQTFQRMAPHHEIDLLSIVILSLPDELLA